MLRMFVLPALAAGLLLSSGSQAEEWTPEPANFSVTDSVKALSGRWAGSGSATMKNGQQENFKCVATYFMNDAASQVRQNLRCKSERLEISLTSNWTVTGEAISGDWQETKYKLEGRLMGNFEETGFSLYAENEFASAAIAVKTSDCTQDVTMTFSKQVELLTASLKKC